MLPTPDSWARYFPYPELRGRKRCLACVDDGSGEESPGKRVRLGHSVIANSELVELKEADSAEVRDFEGTDSSEFRHECALASTPVRSDR